VLGIVVRFPFVFVHRILFVKQNRRVVEHFRQEIATLMGASSLEVADAAPSDASNYTSMAVDDATFLFMQISVLLFRTMLGFVVLFFHMRDFHATGWLC
jgi:hypothetical protein